MLLQLRAAAIPAAAARPAARAAVAAAPAVRCIGAGRRPRAPALPRAAADGSPVTTTAAAPTLASLTAVPVANASTLPATAAVYAVLDAAGAVQYVGMSRRLATTVAGHAKDVAEKAAAVKYAPFPTATRDELTAAWRAWVQEVVETTGGAPPGNLPDGQAAWAPKRAAPPPPEIRLTSGKGLADLTVGLDVLIQAVVDDNPVVAFIKGTRREPKCGFSHSVLTLLTAQLGTGFQVVDVLDETYNPGLRDAIKAFSAWPTIPQVYARGEFLGGADVLAELASKGELGKALKGE